jgi:hypothetical protein
VISLGWMISKILSDDIEQPPDYFDWPKAKTSGKIKAKAILGGLHHSYSRVGSLKPSG